MSDPPSARARLAGLSREQRAAPLRAAPQAQGARRAAPERIPRRPPDLDPVPASFAQERLWFLDRLEPGNPAYNIPLGPAHPGRARRRPPCAAALGEVVRRHEALRTTFGERGRPSRCR